MDIFISNLLFNHFKFETSLSSLITQFVYLMLYLLKFQQKTFVSVSVPKEFVLILFYKI